MPSFDKSNPETVQHHCIDDAQQGLAVTADNPDALAKAIELAVDYRGDVTIVRQSDPQPLTGYIFDRRDGESFDQSSLRMIPTGEDQRVTVMYADVESLTFTGRDTAAGKSFETWMKKYVRDKLAGREASIASESLDEQH